MGNAFGMKKTTKVMKIDGETFKLKTPVKAGEVLKNHPGLVLLESEDVKHYGTRAKALEPNKDLLAGRLYFLVELPTKNSTTTQPRRVRSAINMSAKDRLESLMLTRRSASDLSILNKHKNNKLGNDSDGSSNGSNKENNNNIVNVVNKNGGGGGGGVRVKMRVPRAEVEKLIQGCKDEAEAAEKIMSLYKNGGRESYGGSSSSSGSNNSSGEIIEENNNNNGKKMMELLDQQVQRKGGIKAPRQKRKVSFMPISEGGIQIAVAS